MALRCKEAIIFLLGLVMGTASTIISKIIYETEAEGVNGRIEKFGKPLMTTAVMFMGMAFAMPLYWLFERMKQENGKTDENDGLLNGNNDLDDSALAVMTWQTYASLAIPAAFDLLGTALSGVGLMYTSTSVYQLVRCTVIIVTAVLRATMLGHRVAPYGWFGLFLNTVAMLLVASTSFIQAHADDEVDRDPRVGIFFILLSCLVQGAQYVFEERVMSFNNAPPLVVVGMEGVWGTLLMFLVVFPAAYLLPGGDNGRLEDTYDSWLMLQSNSLLMWMVVIFCVIVFLYNVFCIYVTFLLDAIWHAILDNFRPVAVWTVDLMLYYVFTETAYGERWGYWSWFELAGMCLLFYGTAVYNGSIQLGCFDYTEMEDIEEEDVIKLPPFPKAPGVSSPFMAHSPRRFTKQGTPIFGQSPQRPKTPQSDYMRKDSHHQHGSSSRVPSYGAV